MKYTVIASAVLASLLLSGCNNEQSNNTQSQVTQTKSSVATQVSTKQEKSTDKVAALNSLYQNASETVFKERALSATMYGLNEAEIGFYAHDKMENFSPETEAKLRENLYSISQQIANAELTDQTSQAAINQQVMHSITRYFAGDPNFTIGFIDTWMGLSPFIINQINGPLIDIPRTMQNDHAITNEQQALDYITRLEKFGDVVESVVNKQTFDAKQNWLPPKVTLEGALNYLTNYVKVPAQSHVFVKVFKEKLQSVPDLTDKRKEELISKATAAVADVVYPAFELATVATKALLDKGRDESGIWAQPNGAAYYQDAIKQLGDSELSASEIHQIGVDEVNRISREMDTILVAQGYSKGSVGERMVSLNEEARFLYEDSDAGRAELLSDLNGYIAEITTKMAPVFTSVPKYDVEVKAFPVEVQDGASGGQYTAPAIDGSKPGVYWINLRDMKANPKFSLKTLTYHEANPGHHWQIALNMEQADMPFLRRVAPYNTYIEGWALYSEQVAYELGMYENDPFGNLGRLQAELFRAVRLVVDTGIHDKRWTREQAISYMSEKTGSAESDVTSEIERYMVWPGQALGYKLGMLKILSLRDKAQKALGDKFKLNEFHDVVLLGGAVPMDVLDKNVSAWINSIAK
ncbi:DUF885 domain-containing protein [Litorilituus lipolyticus]|uniref:DUF885 domain-containing protein n=1 Tax=Litorilituus lipolyticus TaxID=2491017 RepID=A0A502KXX4_9GAMM|nr:DUF885 domain-containing protein [Litorilituus lipolyticus]TPH16462.1 DUF885 domain-containing protein [Litorilituus lipolyticus]